jgi:hypothetical protein
MGRGVASYHWRDGEGGFHMHEGPWILVGGALGFPGSRIEKRLGGREVLRLL